MKLEGRAEIQGKLTVKTPFMTDLLTIPCFRRSAYEKWYSPSCAQAAACLGIHLKKIEISSDAVRMEQALPAWGRLLSACLSHSATTSSLPPHALCPCVPVSLRGSSRGVASLVDALRSWVAFGCAKLRDDFQSIDEETRIGSSSLGFCLEWPQAFLLQQQCAGPPTECRAALHPSLCLLVGERLSQHRKCQLQHCSQSSVPAHPGRSGLG